MAKHLNVIGLINAQYILYNDDIYVIEVNPRSSRTIPYISKVTGVPVIDLATKVMLGQKLKDLGYGTGLYREASYFAVKGSRVLLRKAHRRGHRPGPGDEVHRRGAGSG